jgi:hypothetical protein
MSVDAIRQGRDLSNYWDAAQAVVDRPYTPTEQVNMSGGTKQANMSIGKGRAPFIRDVLTRAVSAFMSIPPASNFVKIGRFEEGIVDVTPDSAALLDLIAANRNPIYYGTALLSQLVK